MDPRLTSRSAVERREDDDEFLKRWRTTLAKTFRTAVHLRRNDDGKGDDAANRTDEGAAIMARSSGEQAPHDAARIDRPVLRRGRQRVSTSRNPRRSSESSLGCQPNPSDVGSPPATGLRQYSGNSAIAIIGPFNLDHARRLLLVVFFGESR